MQLVVGEGGELLVLNTPKGFKQPTRMPFGVKTAPKIFQAAIDRLIQGMDGKAPGGIPWEQNFDLIWLFTLYLGKTVTINKTSLDFLPYI